MSCCVLLYFVKEQGKYTSMESKSFALRTDEELVVHLRKGVWPAFDALYDRYWEKLHRAAYHVLKDEAACQDVVQEIFTDLWKRRAQLEVTQVSAYLYRAVKYQVASHIRSHKLHDIYLSQFNQVAQTNTTEETLAVQELEESIAAYMGALPPRCREIFNLSRYQSFSNQQISEHLNISVSTVENQINKALKHLRLSTDRVAGTIVIFSFFVFL